MCSTHLASYHRRSVDIKWRKQEGEGTYSDRYLLYRTYLRVAFPFWGTFVDDRIDTDSGGAGRSGSSDCPDTSRWGSAGPIAWRTICNLQKGGKRKKVLISNCLCFSSFFCEFELCEPKYLNFSKFHIFKFLLYYVWARFRNQYDIMKSLIRW